MYTDRTSVGDTSPVLPIDFLFSPGNTQRRQPFKLVPPRTKILLRDFPANTEFRLTDGCIALYQSLADGRRQILDILGPGAYLGLSIDNLGGCNAEALTFTQIEEVKPLSDSKLGEQLKHLLQRSQALAILLGRKTAKERVACAILQLAHQFERPVKSAGQQRLTFRLYLTRVDLADWLGLTFETVSRCLSNFKQTGLIAFKDPEIITIVDKAALQRLASGQASSPLNAPCPS